MPLSVGDGGVFVTFGDAGVSDSEASSSGVDDGTLVGSATFSGEVSCDAWGNCTRGLQATGEGLKARKGRGPLLSGVEVLAQLCTSWLKTRCCDGELENRRTEAVCRLSETARVSMEVADLVGCEHSRFNLGDGSTCMSVAGVELPLKGWKVVPLSCPCGD